MTMLWQIRCGNFRHVHAENGHIKRYHGNYIPQIAEQLYERFTKKNDIVLDMFFGSGTSGIEAINMGRRCIGVDLKMNSQNLFLKNLRQNNSLPM